MRYLILSYNKKLAERVAQKIISERYRNLESDVISWRFGRDNFEINIDGSIVIEWHSAFANMRGLRCDNLYIDINTPIELVIRSIAAFHRGDKSDVHFFYDKELYERVGADVFGI